MASTRSRQRSFHSWSLALLAFAALACQSNEAGDTGGDSDEEAAALSATEREPPAAAVRVPERDDGASNGASSSSDTSEEPPSDGDPKRAPEPAKPEPVSDEPAAQAVTFAACLDGGGAYSDCETIFVTAVLAEPERCIQLTIDNCGTYGRQGLSADTPTGWRLASGSVSGSAAPCELGEFYSGSSSLPNATGTVTWDPAAPSPTDISLDLALELGEGSEALPLATSTPLVPADCEE